MSEPLTSTDRQHIEAAAKMWGNGARAIVIGLAVLIAIIFNDTLMHNRPLSDMVTIILGITLVVMSAILFLWLPDFASKHVRRCYIGRLIEGRAPPNE